jgi:hypothetical protein
MFQIASGPVIQPAPSPTRGSGLGAALDIADAPTQEGSSTVDDDVDAQAAADMSPIATSRETSGLTVRVPAGLWVGSDFIARFR